MSASGGASRRIAAGTIVRAAGEVVAKLASLAFIIALARELGEGGLGDFVFGVSLATVMFTFAGFGTDQLVAREVARDPDRVHHLFANVVAVKVLACAVLLPLMGAAVLAAGYPLETAAALVLIGAGVAIEVITKSVYAVLQAFERQKFIAATLIVQRTVSASAGIAVLLAGGGLFPVALAFAAASVIGLLTAVGWLYRRVVRPRRAFNRSSWPAIARAGIPVGLAISLYAVIQRADASLLGFLKDSSEVGAFGAALQIVFATKFVTWAFAGATLPWLSRQEEAAGSPLGRGYELGLKALVAALLPVATAVALLAEPLIELIYGSGFEDAVTPLRILGAVIVLYAINSFDSTLMISRSRPGEFARPAALVLVQNLVFNLILIPPFGAVGASVNAVLSGALLVAITERRAVRIVGHVSAPRVLLAPLTSTAALAGVILLTGTELTVVALAAAGVAWLTTFLIVERLAFPDDLRFYAALARSRGRLGKPSAVEPEPLLQ